MTQCAVEFDVGIRFSVKAARGQQKTVSGHSVAAYWCHVGLFENRLSRRVGVLSMLFRASMREQPYVGCGSHRGLFAFPRWPDRVVASSQNQIAVNRIMVDLAYQVLPNSTAKNRLG